MKALRSELLATTRIPVWLGAGIMTAGALAVAGCNLVADEGELPTAVPRAEAETSPLAAADPCTPCAVAGPCAPCDPCAPVAAACAPCSPCGPCAPGAAACAPCAPCAPCGPCAPLPAAACAPCAPCAPCAAVDPCAPCGPCDPCAPAAMAFSDRCEVPRLVEAAACAPCDPCAPCMPCAPCGPCNPCAAAAPCGPCAPCMPCAAAAPCGPCGPCDPCAPAEAPELTAAEANEAYACLSDEMIEAYRASGLAEADAYPDWQRVSTQPYESATHGNRFVQNYVNAEGEAAYTRFEDIDEMPAGGLIAKPSFVATPQGKLAVGPLFLMEKMSAGFMEETGDWRYTMVNPDGSIFGQTGGVNSAGMQFCADCHGAVADDQDHLLFLPEEFRTAGN